MLAQPHARFDHEEYHQQHQDDLDHHAGRGKSHFLEQAGARDHHLRTGAAIHQLGQILVDLGDPAELVAQFGKAHADRIDHFGQPLEQCKGRLEDQRQREHHDREKHQQRNERGEHIVQAPGGQLVGHGREDDGEHDGRRQRQEDHRSDRQDEGQGQKQAQADQQHQRRDQPQLLLRESQPPARLR